MSLFQQKGTGDTKRHKTQFKEINPASEPESDVAGMLELLDQEF